MKPSYKHILAFVLTCLVALNLSAQVTISNATMSGVVSPNAITTNYAGPVNLANISNSFSGTFTGNGEGLTNLMSDQRLVEIVSGESFEPIVIIRDNNGIATNATVKWPDGTFGVLTATSVNSTWYAVDAFTVTYTNRSKTVTQTSVTRDSFGAVTNKPALTID
jgi:hypothetical protein